MIKEDGEFEVQGSGGCEVTTASGLYGLAETTWMYLRSSQSLYTHEIPTGVHVWVGSTNFTIYYCSTESLLSRLLVGAVADHYCSEALNLKCDQSDVTPVFATWSKHNTDHASTQPQRQQLQPGPITLLATRRQPLQPGPIIPISNDNTQSAVTPVNSSQNQVRAEATATLLILVLGGVQGSPECNRYEDLLNTKRHQ